MVRPADQRALVGQAPKSAYYRRVTVSALMVHMNPRITRVTGQIMAVKAELSSEPAVAAMGHAGV